MAEENIIPGGNDTGEQEIDLLELAKKLWKQKRKLVICSICGAVIGLVVAFSLPKEYSASVTLAPEVNDTKISGGSLSALASMAGLSAGASAGADAVYPQLYPDVVSSVPFMTGLFDVKVTLSDDGQNMTLQQYMEEETWSPWWSIVLGAPAKLIMMLKPQEEVPADHKLDSFRLTWDETELVKALRERISTSVDQKTSVVTIDVMMQDPLVAAMLADTVVSRLQTYITEYRTSKARQDLAYAEKLNEEAKQDYYKAQQRYADYLDRNQGMILYSAKTVSERLQNEATLAFNLYNQTAQKVQMAQAKVQETTPVYAVVSPATVPVKPTSPKKLMILVGFTFLAFAACAGWILYLQPLLRKEQSV